MHTPRHGLLRAAGFKIVLHWMPNLHGATRTRTARTSAGFGTDSGPDEIKIYPNQLLANADLHNTGCVGSSHRTRHHSSFTCWRISSRQFPLLPRQPRSSGHPIDQCREETAARVCGRIFTGTEAQRARAVSACAAGRCAAGRSTRIHCSSTTCVSGRPFLSTFFHLIHLMTGWQASCGCHCRNRTAPQTGLRELELRPSFVRYTSMSVPGCGSREDGSPQHVGLGTRLLERASAIARQAGFARLAVIAAVGTRKYYLERGFQRGDLYLSKELS